jgi:hypothetical protein
MRRSLGGSMSVGSLPGPSGSELLGGRTIAGTSTLDRLDGSAGSISGSGMSDGS